MSCMPCDVAGAGVCRICRVYVAGAGVCRVCRVMSQVQVYVVYAV